MSLLSLEWPEGLHCCWPVFVTSKHMPAVVRPINLELRLGTHEGSIFFHWCFAMVPQCSDEILLCCVVLCWVGLGWVGLGCVGLGCVGDGVFMI